MSTSEIFSKIEYERRKGEIERKCGKIREGATAARGFNWLSLLG